MEDHQQNREEVFTKRVKAGKRTYFFDVKATRGNDFYITITESKKKLDENYVKHKIFLYKEDFQKFTDALHETIGHVKTNLLPEYDFEEFSRRDSGNSYGE